jgi:transcriptional regulator with XRE-family HTH domain
MRRQAGLSQSQLGGGVIWRSAVSRIESGVRAPSITTLHLFATVVRCALREFLVDL